MSAGPVFALGPGRELRPLREADTDELYDLVDANRARLGRWMQWAEAQTRERTLEFIRETQAQHDAGEGYQGAVVDGARDGARGRIVGVAGMHRIDTVNRAVELGYWLDERAEGSGIMTAAVAALVGHAFAALGLHRVQICAAVDNERSRALIERLGFRFEGVARGRYRIGDGWHDDAVYAMLAGEHARLGGAHGDSRDGEAHSARLSAGERT